MDPWIVIVIIVSGICAAISLAISKKVSSSPASLLNENIAKGDVMSVIRQSEHQMKNGKSLSDRQQVAFIYCKFCAKNALSCYTQGFPYLKDPRDKVIFDVMYYIYLDIKLSGYCNHLKYLISFLNFLVNNIQNILHIKIYINNKQIPNNIYF